MVGCPIIGINDSAGARIQDAVTSLAWYAELGRRHELLRGLVPEVSIILGKCAGGAVYSPIQTDLVVAVRDQGYMFVTGPDVIKDVTGEDVQSRRARRRRRAGPLRQHPSGGRGRGGGVPVRPRLPELPARQHVRRRADRQSRPGAGGHAARPELDSIVPDSDNMAYDMHEILLRIFDDGDVFDVAAAAGPGDHHRVRARRRAAGRRDRQPADAPVGRDRQRGRPTRRRASSGSATPTISHWFSSSTPPASCPASSRRRAASSSAAADSSTPSSRPTCRR